MKLYIIAGEASGDSHGAELMRSLRARCPEVEFHGAGGPKMRALTGGGFSDWSEHAVIGVVDVLRNYGYFKAQFERMAREIADVRPDGVVFIDYPGFNLRMAERLRRDLPGIRLIYYISPQVWAWNRGRIPKMARILDLMLCIFPFEKPLYEKSGLRTEFVGHPMVDALGELRTGAAREPGLVALLPGSRVREVRKIFPALLRAVPLIRRDRPDARFEAAAANESLAALMRESRDAEGVADSVCRISTGTAYDVMQRAEAGVVASGTATLEAAFFGLPFVLVYKVSWATYLPAKFLVSLEHIGMVNILAGREVVRELIQHAATPAAVAANVASLLEDERRRGALQAGLANVIGLLGGGGASDHAADAILREVGHVA